EDLRRPPEVGRELSDEGGVAFDSPRRIIADTHVFDETLALVSDLHQRGLDEDVAVVVWSEFGRTPRINDKAGRDHFPTGSVLLAGGGFKRGQVIGATDSRGERSTSVAYRSASILATLYRHLGIDPAATLPDLTGRPMYLLDDRRLISELL
ncbi:MAG: DUF1501 domain-containing protein, partial [Planctomycetota bacterium]